MNGKIFAILVLHEMDTFVNIKDWLDWFLVFDATFNSISVISWLSILRGSNSDEGLKKV
jgi:hypothetical protein